MCPSFPLTRSRSKTLQSLEAGQCSDTSEFVMDPANVVVALLCEQFSLLQSTNLVPWLLSVPESYQTTLQLSEVGQKISTSFLVLGPALVSITTSDLMGGAVHALSLQSTNVMVPQPVPSAYTILQLSGVGQ